LKLLRSDARARCHIVNDVHISVANARRECMAAMRARDEPSLRTRAFALQLLPAVSLLLR